jgi:uncharacterized protein YbbC (DUF1343 family)
MSYNSSKICCIFLIISMFLTHCGTTPVNQPIPVATGADQTELYIHLITSKAVGLVANHTTIIGRNTHLADTLLKLGVNIVKIYSPEHGFRGDIDAGDEIGNTMDSKTGLPIVSLYGEKMKPTPADLQGVEIMIYDIQDVGVRFYTYISTMHYIMEACAENNIPMMILDRPDPLGHYVDGPLLEHDFRSFVGLHPIPVVYGMTPGELARMINGEGWLDKSIHCDLVVIPCNYYDHNTYYKLPVNPSPNLNCMETIYLYPSICFFEGTVMSLGRGTSFPFRVIGNPAYPDKSFSFVPIATPANQNPVLKDQTCYGIDLSYITADSLRGMTAINLQWLIKIYEQMNMGRSFFTDYIDLLAGSDELKNQILKGLTEQQIKESWQPELEKFKAIRKKYLLYNDFHR